MVSGELGMITVRLSVESNELVGAWYLLMSICAGREIVAKTREIRNVKGFLIRLDKEFSDVNYD